MKKISSKKSTRKWTFKKSKIYWIGLALVVSGIALFLDQLRIHGRLFEFADINNHETVALFLLGLGIPTVLWGMQVLKETK